MAKFMEMHWENLLWCEDAINYIPTTMSSTRKLELNDFQGAWFLLGCGSFASFSNFLWELSYTRFIRIRKKN